MLPLNRTLEKNFPFKQPSQCSNTRTNPITEGKVQGMPLEIRSEFQLHHRIPKSARRCTINKARTLKKHRLAPKPNPYNRQIFSFGLQKRYTP